MNLKQAFNNAGIVKTITIPYSRVWVGVDFVHTGMCLQRGRKVPSKSTKDKGLRAKKISNAKASLLMVSLSSRACLIWWRWYCEDCCHTHYCYQ